jgi:ATP-binding protein involved in chromosome partitioning
VAVNLALSLSALGNRVGLLDLDIYGPSLPTLLPATGQNYAHLSTDLSPGVGQV